jgi:hypothetical protein
MPGIILNQDLEFTAAPPEACRAFLGQWAEKRLLPCGYELYKFTHHPLFRPDGTVTPWWSSVKPLTADDPGLAGSLQRGQALGVAPPEFARARTAVTRQWNRMSGLLRARLLVPVYGFAGRCASQPFDEDAAFANVVYIGGAWQLWIPSLTAREIAAV